MSAASSLWLWLAVNSDCGLSLSQFWQIIMNNKETTDKFHRHCTSENKDCTIRQTLRAMPHKRNESVLRTKTADSGLLNENGYTCEGGKFV